MCGSRARGKPRIARGPVVIHEATTSNYAITMHHRDKLVILRDPFDEEPPPPVSVDSVPRLIAADR